MRDLARVFASLADPTRLDMVGLLLRHGELCVCDFVGVLEITQSKASRHLRTLWHAGLLADRRAGLWVHYRIAESLGPERAAIIGAVRALVADRNGADLERRYRRWMGQKARTGPACKPARRVARAAAAEGHA